MKKASILITEYRKAANISQGELAQLLTDYGYPTTNKVISSWENDSSVPNANQYLAICEVLNINNSSVTDLTLEGQYKVRDYINTLMMIDKYRNKKRELPLYSVAVSAGTGQYIDDSDYEMIEVGDEVPKIADYAIRISGDSMEPVIHHKDILWVQSTTELSIGNIGIFYLDGEVYCKVLQRNKLVSLNPTYHDIDITKANEFKILGKVVS